MEEELFPHRMSLEEPRGLEEERRLCYVGITRAKEKLLLTYAESRYLHGLEKMTRPSRFLNEIPPTLIEAIRPLPTITRPSSPVAKPPLKTATAHTIENTNLSVGQRVKHTKFGHGIIINYEGSGEHTRLQVKFDESGVKWLVASYAKLMGI